MTTSLNVGLHYRGEEPLGVHVQVLEHHDDRILAHVTLGELYGAAVTVVADPDTMVRALRQAVRDVEVMAESLRMTRDMEQLL